MKTLPEILEDLRTDHDYSQVAIAQKLHVSQQTYSNYETGKSEIPATQLKILAELYGVSADFLLGLDYRLHTPFIGTISVQKFLSKAVKLSPEGRKIALDNIDFLLTKYGDK